MEVNASRFAYSLIEASRATGSLLRVAQLLGVEPKQVYLWIADVEQPFGEQRRNFEDKLRPLVAR